MDLEEILSNEELRTLQLAPFWVFSSIAGADGKIDEKEKKAFSKELKDSSLYKNPLTKAILTTLNNEMDTLLTDLSSDPRNIEEGIRSVREIAEKADEKGAVLFCEDLFALGIRIADASGGFLGLGDKISEDEWKILEKVASWLDVDIEKLMTRGALKYNDKELFSR